MVTGGGDGRVVPVHETVSKDQVKETVETKPEARESGDTEPLHVVTETEVRSA